MKGKLRTLVAMVMTAMMLTSCGANAGSGNTANSGSGSQASGSATVSADPITMKLGLSFADSHLITQELYAMSDAVKERTNGGIRDLRRLPAGQGDRDVRAAVHGHHRHGPGDHRLPEHHPPRVDHRGPALHVRHPRGRHKALDGGYGDKINEIIASDGQIRNLGFMELGYRHMTNNVRPINTPDDMKGIKFRTTTSDLRLAVFEALGAQPVSMSFSEVFTGLQQNVIDGQESPLSTIDSSSFAEVQKYLSLTGHFWTNECLLINEKLWDSLPEEWQTILQEEVDACETRIREKNVQSDEELVAKLESEGMEVNEVDKAAFAEQLQPLYDEWEGKVIGSDLMNAYREYSGY